MTVRTSSWRHPFAFETVHITAASEEQLLSDLSAAMMEGQGFTVATLNLDHVVKLRRDDKFKVAYIRHTHVVADGNPIVWLCRLAGQPINLIPGSDLIAPLCDLAVRLGVPVALLGAKQDTLDISGSRLERAHPGLRIVAKIAPGPNFDPEGDEANACLEQLRAAGAQLCLIALGAPKQELLAVRGLDFIPSCGFVSVGAGLDFIAGTQQRAPRWVRKLALEWLWRLSGDWRRLTLRYARCAIVLPDLVVSALRARGNVSASPDTLTRPISPVNSRAPSTEP